MAGGATGPITKAITRRRVRRHQWRIFECIVMVILDAWLITLSFQLAYALREYIANTPALNHLLNYIRYTMINHSAAPPSKPIPLAPFANFTLMEISIVIGLLVILAARGLYKHRLTGTWFKQIWAIISSATIGEGLLISYYFIIQPQNNSRLPVADHR